MAIMLNQSYLSVQITRQDVFYGGRWMPKAAPIMHNILLLQLCTGLPESFHCNQGFFQSAKEEIQTDDIGCNLPDDF